MVDEVISIGFQQKIFKFSKTNENIMDFLTAIPYWGILLIVIINAIIVSRMDVQIKEEEQ